MIVFSHCRIQKSDNKVLYTSNNDIVLFGISDLQDTLNYLEQSPKDFKGKKLFNGRSFKSWEGNNGIATLEWFRIESQCIVGGS